MTLEIKDVLYIVGMLITGIVVFLSTQHNIKDYVRDKHDELKKKLTN